MAGQQRELPAPGEPDRGRATRRGSGRRRAGPRQVDVARLAGVSSAVVSVVVNGREGQGIRVRPETRERVWRAVRETGYVPDPVARSLAGGRSQLLGVFTYEPVFPMDERNFYHPFLVGIENAAESHDYDLMLFTRTGGTRRRQIYRDGVNALKLADGAILIGTNEDRGELARLAGEGFPFVFVGRREVPGAEISYAAADYAGATEQLVGRILDLGHRRIAYLAATWHHESGHDRHRGYRAAHEHRGLELDPHLTLSMDGIGVNADLVRSLLERATAIVTATSALCARLLRVLSSLEISAPDDLSVACLGNAMDDVEVPDGVATFDVPRQDMGAESVRLLHELVASPDRTDPHRCVLPCSIVPGSSIGPPRTS